MKLQSLAVIFIIIIMPITIVLSEYINNKIETEETEILYNTRLLNSTYDAIKAYQLNTVNNAFGDVTNKKIQDIEAAAKTFYNSLTSTFNYTGYRSEVMKEYVPAIVFTMYDGYYTYTPFNNTVTEVKDDDIDPDYSENGKTQEGLKPYVYYACRYTDGSNNDFSIIYTLDNYITIQGTVNGKYTYDNGYLYTISSDGNNGLYKRNDDTYVYLGTEIKKSDTEELKEYVGSEEYSYAKINGKKYYLDENYYQNSIVSGNISLDNGKSISGKSGIFFIDTNGTKNYNQVRQYKGTSDTSDTEFLKYCNAIKNNKSAFEYYKDAYEFSSAVLGTSSRTDKSGTVHSNGYNLKNLKASNATIWNEDPTATNTTSLKESGDIDIFGGSTNIEKGSSNFNEHRKMIIRHVIETNLSTAIAGFSSDKVSNFIMPKISETDWETIENDVCAISFLQGMSIGAKKYNGYSVVANTLTKEYVDENDIYILKSDNTYCKVNDNTLPSGMESKNTLGYYPGVWKLNFEQRQALQNVNGTEDVVYYNPVKYYGSYTSIMGSYGRTSIADTDMYSYIKNKDNTLKKVYLAALGRERWGAYNVNNINYELYGNTNGNEYFLKDY